MSDLIERDKAKMAVRLGVLSAATIYGRTDEGMTARKEIERAIDELPSAQPDKDALDDAYAHGYTAAESEFRKRMEKLERKTGKWILNNLNNGYGMVYHCTECNWLTTNPQYAYCPNCGADMRGTKE